jgi:hypothetical protein
LNDKTNKTMALKTFGGANQAGTGRAVTNMAIIAPGEEQAALNAINAIDEAAKALTQAMRLARGKHGPIPRTNAYEQVIITLKGAQQMVSSARRNQSR